MGATSHSFGKSKTKMVACPSTPAILAMIKTLPVPERTGKGGVTNTCSNITASVSGGSAEQEKQTSSNSCPTTDSRPGSINPARIE